MEKAIFGAGCFWGVEEEFRKLEGVTNTRVGYSGGDKEKPTYEEVCTDTTGHAEVVEITFDPNKISYKELLNKFFELHDPTQLDKQGPDVGKQYRSVIFYTSDKQKEEAKEFLNKLQESEKYSNPVVTEIEEAGEFYEAEDYHQKYLMKRGGGTCHY